MSAPETRVIQLRFPGVCRSCGAELEKGTRAVHDRATRKVTCLPCHGARAVQPPASIPDVPPSLPAAPMPIDLGVAGDSAAREHQKRRANRERRIEARWGRMAPLVVRLDRWTGEPQSQRAWARGAHGEAKVAAELAKHLGDPVTLLHDRRVPGSKANIDHIAVGPGGVTVIDSKNLTGDVRIERWGGLFTERSSHLVVNGRKRRGLVTGVQKQVGLVAGCLRDAGLTVDVRGVLCMANTDALPLKAAFKRLEIDGVRVSGPRRTAELAARPGDPPIDVDAVARLLAERFPRA